MLCSGRQQADAQQPAAGQASLHWGWARASRQPSRSSWFSRPASLHTCPRARPRLPSRCAQVEAAVQARAGSASTTLEARVTQVKQALEAAGLQVVDVSGRAKNLYGVWKKANKSGQPVRAVPCPPHPTPNPCPSHRPAPCMSGSAATSSPGPPTNV